jgi:hypothetical protein
MQHKKQFLNHFSVQKRIMYNFFWGGGQLNFVNPLKMPVLSISGFEFQAHLNKILIFLWLLLGSQLVIAQGGQEICSMPADCGKLSIEMIRLETPTSSCPMDNSGCVNLFYQRGYKLYLKYTLPQAPINNPIVALNYQSLSLSVPFRSFATGTSAPGRSQINKAATLGCFANEHAYWNNYNNGNGDKVIFDVNNNYVSIDFYSNPSDLNHPCGIGGTTGNQLVFDFSTHPPVVSSAPGVTFATCMGGYPSQPIGTCAYLELFTVIVDAYPGEIMGFDNTSTPFIRQYISKDATIVCSSNDITVANSGTFNAFGNSPVAPNPIAFANTANAGIVLEFTTPMPTTNDPEIKTLDVVLRNKGTTDLEVKYIEFLLDAIVQGDNIKLGFTGDLSSLGYVDLINGVSKVFQNKIKLAGAISAGGFKKIGTINLGPSSIYSTQWQANLSFITDMAKARIITTAACTNLNVAPLPVQIIEQGTPQCTNTDIHFSMDVTSTTCGLYNVKVTLQNTNANAKYRVGGFSLTLLPISNGGVNSAKLKVLDPALINGFTDWPWPTTGVSTCQNQCGNQNYCFTNNTFKYCFETNAVDFFINPNGTQGSIIDMDIPISYKDNVCITDIIIVNASITLFTVVNGQTVLQSPCLPFLAPNTGLPSCASGGTNSIVGTIKTELNQGIEDVNVTIAGGVCPTSNPCQPFDMVSDIDGNYSACQICFDCSQQKITPVLDLDPLNGVNTYDLILISRHILGLEPLNTPYKLISADANKSGTVSTFDIVELRKLILGTYTSFSQIQVLGGQATQKSWRFVDKNQVFTNADNPFANTILESITLNAASLPNSQVNFIGTKIGDVDNTAAPHSKMKRPNSSLGFMTNTAAKGGDIITVPVYYQGETVMDGLQFALKFDPNVWELIGPSAGDIAVVPDHFGLFKADQGSIGFSWNTIEGETEAVQPGTLLFNLSFKAKGDIVSAEPLLQIDYAAVSDGAWTHDGTEHHLVAAPVAVSREQMSHHSVAPEVKAVPNPTTGLSTLYFNTSVAGKIRLVLTDAYGRQLSLREVATEAGQQAIVVQELEHRAAGIYHWWLKMPDGTVIKGQIIKI